MNKTLMNKFSKVSIEPSPQAIIDRFVEYLKFHLGKDQFSATPYDTYVVLLQW